MIKRISAVLIFLTFLAGMMKANEEFNVVLDNGKKNSQTIEAHYSSITFKLTQQGEEYRVDMYLENLTPSEAILLFKQNMDEKALKKQHPKVEFEKTYPGSKGKRTVEGFPQLYNYIQPVVPQENIELTKLPVGMVDTLELKVPLYRAKYDYKKLLKKGPYETPYKILSQEILDFKIIVEVWSVNNPEYVAKKRDVENFIQSLKTVDLCNNAQHYPAFNRQLKPYEEQRDSLIEAIKLIIKEHPEWTAASLAYQSYSALIDKLENIDFNTYAIDCGKHKGKDHSCSYCKLSAQQVYHQLDDLYQKLRNGKISKDAAIKQANVIYNCYKSNKKRKKDSNYTDKIAKFYTRITE